MYVCMYVCIRIYIGNEVRRNKPCIYVCVYVCICMFCTKWERRHAGLCTCVCMYTQKTHCCVHTYTHIHAYMHTCIYVLITRAIVLESYLHAHKHTHVMWSYECAQVIKTHMHTYMWTYTHIWCAHIRLCSSWWISQYLQSRSSNCKGIRKVKCKKTNFRSNVPLFVLGVRKCAWDSRFKGRFQEKYAYPQSRQRERGSERKKGRLKYNHQCC